MVIFRSLLDLFGRPVPHRRCAVARAGIRNLLRMRLLCRPGMHALRRFPACPALSLLTVDRVHTLTEGRRLA